MGWGCTDKKHLRRVVGRVQKDAKLECIVTESNEISQQHTVTVIPQALNGRWT